MKSILVMTDFDITKKLYELMRGGIIYTKCLQYQLMPKFVIK